MNQLQSESYWKLRSKRRENAKETDFARKCWNFLKKKNCKTLLDLGCGDGRDSLYFARKGFEVTAVDISQIALNIIQKKQKEIKLKNITCVKNDITKLQFPKNSFDVIYCHLSLHYFSDRETTKIFNKVYEILKPQGHIFILCKSTKDSDFGKGKEIEKNLFVDKNKYVRHFFDEEYMKEKLGFFKIVKLRETKATYMGLLGKKTSHFIEAIATKKHCADDYRNYFNLLWKNAKE